MKDEMILMALESQLLMLIRLKQHLTPEVYVCEYNIIFNNLEQMMSKLKREQLENLN